MEEGNSKKTGLSNVADVLEFQEDVQKYIALLEAENARLKEQNQAYEIGKARSERELARLAEEKNNFDVILAEREAVQRRLEKEVAGETDELNRLAASVAAHIHKASEAEKETGRINEEYVRLQEVVAQEHEAHEKARESASALKGRVDDLEGRLAENRQAAAGKDGEIQRLQAEIEGYQIEVKRYKENLHELQARAGSAEQGLDAAQPRLAELDRLQRDAEQYQAQISLLEKRLAEHARALSKAEEEAARRKIEYEQSQWTLKGVESMARELGDTVRKQKEEIRQHSTRASEYERTTRTYTQTVAELRRDLENNNSALVAVREDNLRLKDELERTKKELGEYETRLKALSSIGATMQSVKEKLARRTAGQQ